MTDQTSDEQTAPRRRRTRRCPDAPISAFAMRYRTDVSERVRQLIRTYRSQDKKAGVGVCDLDPDEMIERVRMGICEVTGAPLHLGPVGGGGMRKREAFAFSFDRTDNHLPHTKENTKVVCTIYNIMKSTFPDEDVAEFIRILQAPARAAAASEIEALRQEVARLRAALSEATEQQEAVA